jgi:hypothetical protein
LNSSAISDILTAWENDSKHAYGAPLVELNSEGRPIFVVSDLHAGAGLGDDGTYDGLENFFADAALVRFLEWAHPAVHGPHGAVVAHGIATLGMRRAEGDVVGFGDRILELHHLVQIDNLQWVEGGGYHALRAGVQVDAADLGHAILHAAQIAGSQVEIDGREVLL